MVNEIIYTTISWMICSRFKHLNKMINLLKKDTILNTYKFKLIIEWYSRNIKQIIKYNTIFGLGLSGYYFAMTSRLMLSLEDLVFDYGKLPNKVFICDIFFTIHKILLLLYITKQISDISKETSKTSRFVNELCIIKLINGKGELVENLRKNVNIVSLFEGNANKY